MGSGAKKPLAFIESIFTGEDEVFTPAMNNLGQAQQAAITSMNEEGNKTYNKAVKRVETDALGAARAAENKKSRSRATRTRSPAGTLLTGQLGVPGNAPVAQKTLLGM